MAEPEITAATTNAIAVRINPRDWFNGETFCGLSQSMIFQCALFARGTLNASIS
jgi:hypothetical protein